jgi:DNA topoisomerase-3
MTDHDSLTAGPCQYPTLGFVCDQHFRVQSFVPETFWYISISLERDENTVLFKWARGHLFDFEFAVVLYEMCVEAPLAQVKVVKTKPTQKW